MVIFFNQQLLREILQFFIFQKVKIVSWIQSLNDVVNSINFSESQAKTCCWDPGLKGTTVTISNMERNQLLLNYPKIFIDPESQSLSSVTKTEEDALFILTFSFASGENFQDYPCCVWGGEEGRHLAGGCEMAETWIIVVWYCSEDLSGEGDRKSPFSKEEKCRYSKCVSM